MGRAKIVDTYYDDLYGASFLTKKTPEGEFSVTVIATDEDEPYANYWCGMRFAEYKTDLKILKAKIKRQKARATGVLYAYKHLCQNTSEDDPTMKKLLKYYKLCLKEIDKMESSYQKGKQQYPDFTTSVIDMRKELLEKKRNS